MLFYKRDSAVEAITFQELIDIGRLQDKGVNGMPWSFHYKQWPVTHEHDSLYIVGPRHFKRDEMLIVDRANRLYTLPLDVFLDLFEPADA